MVDGTGSILAVSPSRLSRQKTAMTGSSYMPAHHRRATVCRHHLILVQDVLFRFAL
jgi:hypothetical protein